MPRNKGRNKNLKKLAKTILMKTFLNHVDGASDFLRYKAIILIKSCLNQSSVTQTQLGWTAPDLYKQLKCDK